MMLSIRQAAVYKAAVFLSALLTFSVQPLVAKRLLPLLGGAPAVWNTCLLFFQIMLLAGYVLADRVVRIDLGWQRKLHPLLLVIAASCVPLWLRPITPPPATADPALWVLSHLTLTIGVPFFALCSNATVVQSWYAAHQPEARDEAYRLYRWSNAGSLLGLLAYPIAIEPFLTVGQQQRAWSLLYAVLVLLIAVCARMVRATRVQDVTATVPPEPWSRRALWVALAFLPASFTLSVTSHVTSDLAAVPLFWVVPLALYLLSFVLAFGAGRRISPQQAAPAVRVLILAVTIVYFAGAGSAWWLSGLASLACLFTVALLCHGRLSDLRPDARHLSTFYLCLALGGALGGLFNALIAPRIFAGLAEYPLGMILAAFLLPPVGPRSRRDRLVDLETGFATFALVVIVVFLAKRLLDPGPLAMVAIFLIPSLIALRAGRQPLRFGACVAGIILGAVLMMPQGIGRLLYQDRTFFGVLRVALQRSTYHALLHGSTTHGQQNMRHGERGTPLGYYHRASPIGQVLEATARARPVMSVGVVGLGTGTLAAYSRESDNYRFFEIDPGVERIARDPAMFTYLADAVGHVAVILVDARVSIERDDTRFDVLVLDAFSSDAIPVHLLTREAFGLYENRLTSGGLVAVHVSNRYLDMRPALASLAGELALDMLVQDQAVSDEAARLGYASSRWVLLRRRDEPSPVWDAMRMGEWRAYRGTASPRAWSDDYSNLVQAVLTGFKEL